MKPTDPDIEDLDEVNPPPVPPTEVMVPAPDINEYRGRKSKVALARPLYRNHQVLGPREQCLDCLAAGKPNRFDHQFHIAATKDANGRWIGPEADHLDVLRADGMLANTPEFARWQAEQARVDAIRGVERDELCRNCGKRVERNASGELSPVCATCGVRNGLDELRPLDATRLRKILHQELGEEKARAAEQALLSEEKKAAERNNVALAELAKAVAALASRNDSGTAK
jgi:hypothetical protein